MRILLVEDDDLFGSAAQKWLTHLGYAIDWVKLGCDVPFAMDQHEYEAVLLDLGLSDATGEEVLKSMRARHPGVSVIVMTARGSVHDRVSLLNIGADDYIVKPVDFTEVDARLRAVNRRSHAAPAELSRLEHGGLILVPARREATWHGERIALTNKEFWLLETFMRRKGQVLTRAQLEETLYGWGEEIGSNTVEVYVHFLRRKFRPELIQTVRGVGYQLGSTSAYDN